MLILIFPDTGDFMLARIWSSLTHPSSALISACRMYSAEEPLDTLLNLVQLLAQNVDPWDLFDDIWPQSIRYDIEVFG